MNMRINQQSLEAFISDAVKSKGISAKQIKGSFGKALAGALKAVPRQDSQQVSPEPREVAVRPVTKANTLFTVPKATNAQVQENLNPQSATPDPLTAPQGEQAAGLIPNGEVAGSAGQVQGQHSRENSAASAAIKPEQGGNGDEQPWWLELMNLLSFLAQLADIPEMQVPGMQMTEPQISATQAATQIAELQIAEPQIAELQIAEPQIAELQIAEPQIAEIQVPATLISEEPLSEVPVEFGLITVPENSQYLKLTSPLGLANIQTQGQSRSDSEDIRAVPNPVATQLNQPGEQVDTQLVPVIEETNRTELQKLSAKLKPLLEQLVQGKVTVSAAAEAILGTPGLMEQIALQVKLLKLQQPNQLQLTEEAALALQQPDLAEANGEAQPRGRVLEVGGSATSKPAIPEEIPELPATPGKLGTVTTANGTLVDPSGKQGQDSKVDFRKGDKEGNDLEVKAGSGSRGHQEFSATLTKADTLFKAVDTSFKVNELEQQPWVLPPGLKNDDQSPEALSRTVRTQTANTARELATHLIFKQIVNNSQLLVGRDHSEIRIQLRPEFLGKVSLEIAVEHGIVKAEIAAENQQVKQLIEANLGNLKQTLTNQGLKVDQLVVNLGQGQSQFGQAKGQGGQPGRSTRRSQDSEVVFEVGEITGEYGGHLAEENRVVDYKV